MAHLTFPLRGLAGEGAQAVVDRALGGLAGIRSARADATSPLLQVEYDAEQIASSEIHDALRRAGIVHVADTPDEGGREAPGRQGESDESIRVPKGGA